MRDYDSLTVEWLPYVMRFQPPNLSTSSFATDENGFRNTLWRQNPLSLGEFNQSGCSRGALIGASTAFGIGASSDANTLASVLNRREDRMWFNFGGRSHNSTQELLMFLLFLPSDVDEVVILSGINNLALSLGEVDSSIYSPFYSESEFASGLKFGSVTGVRGSLNLLLRELSNKLLRAEDEKEDVSTSEKYDRLAACFCRDLRIWTLLREALGFRLSFVLQPVATWIDKVLTPEERKLFAILDELSGPHASLMTYMLEQRDRYARDVAGICEELEVPFLDLNSRPSFAEERWLFVDRVHLTDGGYALAAEEIEKEFLP